MSTERPLIEVSEEQATEWVDGNLTRNPDGSVTSPTREPSVTPRNEAAERLRGHITSLRHHDSVDAAYECQSGLDRCHDCEQDYADLDAALRTERLRVVEQVRERLTEAFEQERATSEGNGWSHVHGRSFVIERVMAGLTGEEPSNG